ncbi:MAG: SMP-30/gluconolactonase/LRE family protein [Acidobacteriota bacterium]|nr:SMP-30/gluconolactonase/LRE family protein [Acidobacteriota bacterium]
MSFKTSDFKVICSGLGYPEGPVALPDGSVLVCEISAGALSRITPDGQRTVVAQLGGSPNGAAIGPDGKVYVCNSGGFAFLYFRQDGSLVMPGSAPPPGAICLTGDQPPTYTGGSIQRVDLATGTFETLYTQCSAPDFPGAPTSTTHPLRGPDDLVFDEQGGFWFTDWGKSRPRERDIPGLYYAKADGSSIIEKVFPLNAPNGVALSPDGRRLYVAETYTRMVRFWELDGPGQIAKTGPAIDHSHVLTSQVHGVGILDSMKVDEDGNVYVVTMLDDGYVVRSNGGLTIISPEGERLEFIDLEVGEWFDPLPSNFCFGGPDRRTAFITLGGTGRLVSCQMRVPGLKPAYNVTTT